MYQWESNLTSDIALRVDAHDGLIEIVSFADSRRRQSSLALRLNLELFYGARKQVFFTFGPYVLILFYGANAMVISLLFAISAIACLFCLRSLVCATAHTQRPLRHQEGRRIGWGKHL